jgi:hypothetical protein
MDQHAALRTRLVVDSVTPTNGAFDALSAWVAANDALFIPIRRFSTMRFDSWILRYSGSQKLRLQQAHDSLIQRGLRESEMACSSMFVKLETKNFAWQSACWPSAKEVKPRVIISCSPRIKVALGPTIVSFTEQLREVWHKDAAIYFECGSSQDDVAYWFNKNLARFGEECLYMTDFTLMDRTQSSESMAILRRMLQVRGARGLALQCLRRQEKPQRVYSRDGERVACPAFLRSGVPNTTLYNSMMNALLHYYHFSHRGKPLQDFVMMVRGDDNLIFAKPEVVEGIVETAASLGFKLKLTKARTVDRARFCSNAFYPTSDRGYVPAPTIGKCLTKLCYTTSTIRKGGERAHMRGVALGLLALTNHVPLLHDYITRVLELTAGAHGKEFQRALAAARMKYLPGTKHDPAAHGDEYVAHMYGVTVDAVSQVRKLIQSMSAPGYYGNPATIAFFRAALDVEAG